MDYSSGLVDWRSCKNVGRSSESRNRLGSAAGELGPPSEKPRGKLKLLQIGLQISLVPLCAFLGLFRSRSSTSLLGALTFAVLISLQLWSIRSSPLGIALSALQIAAECWKWRSLQLMAHEEDGEDQLMRTSGVSAPVSIRDGSSC